MPVTFSPASHKAHPIAVAPVTAAQILERAAPHQYAQADRITQTSIGGRTGTQPQHKIVPSPNGFVVSVLSAYSGHHALIVRPDDVWLAIVAQFSLFLHSAANSELLRAHFAAPDAVRELQVVGDPIDFPTFARRMGDLVARDLVNPELRKWIVPDFSTTTLCDATVGSMLMLCALKKYTEVKMEVLCGIPRVTIEGEKNDWAELLARLEKLKEFGLTAIAWYHILYPIVSQFVDAFDAPSSKENIAFWNTVATKEPLGTVTTQLTGWISAFCVFDARGEWCGPKLEIPKAKKGVVPEGLGAKRFWTTYTKPLFGKNGPTYPAVSAEAMPPAYAEVDVIVENAGKRTQSSVVAGLVGTGLSSSRDQTLSESGRNDTVRPVVAWWVYSHLTEETIERRRRRREKRALEQAQEAAPPLPSKVPEPEPEHEPIQIRPPLATNMVYPPQIAADYSFAPIATPNDPPSRHESSGGRHRRHESFAAEPQNEPVPIVVHGEPFPTMRNGSYNATPAREPTPPAEPAAVPTNDFGLPTQNGHSFFGGATATTPNHNDPYSFSSFTTHNDTNSINNNPYTNGTSWENPVNGDSWDHAAPAAEATPAPVEEPQPVVIQQAPAEDDWTAPALSKSQKKKGKKGKKEVAPPPEPEPEVYVPPPVERVPTPTPPARDPTPPPREPTPPPREPTPEPEPTPAITSTFGSWGGAPTTSTFGFGLGSGGGGWGALSSTPTPAADTEADSAKPKSTSAFGFASSWGASMTPSDPAPAATSFASSFGWGATNTVAEVEAELYTNEQQNQETQVEAETVPVTTTMEDPPAPAAPIETADADDDWGMPVKAKKGKKGKQKEAEKPKEPEPVVVPEPEPEPVATPAAEEDEWATTGAKAKKGKKGKKNAAPATNSFSFGDWGNEEGETGVGAGDDVGGQVLTQEETAAPAEETTTTPAGGDAEPEPPAPVEEEKPATPAAAAEEEDEWAQPAKGKKGKKGKKAAPAWGGWDDEEKKEEAEKKEETPAAPAAETSGNAGEEGDKPATGEEGAAPAEGGETKPAEDDWGGFAVKKGKKKGGKKR